MTNREKPLTHAERVEEIRRWRAMDKACPQAVGDMLDAYDALRAETSVKSWRARLLREAADEIVAMAEPDQTYGHPLSSDPRLFKPDPECSTEAERAAHADALAAWERGQRPEVPPSWTSHPTRADAEAYANGLIGKGAGAATIAEGPGGWAVHCHAEGWGMGTSTHENVEASIAADYLRTLAASLPILAPARKGAK